MRDRELLVVTRKDLEQEAQIFFKGDRLGIVVCNEGDTFSENVRYDEIVLVNISDTFWNNWRNMFEKKKLREDGVIYEIDFDG